MEGVGAAAPGEDVAAQIPLDGKLMEKEDLKATKANRILEVR